MCLSGATAADGPLAERRTWDFEADAAGASASGFKPIVGTWSVMLDGKNHVLSQTAKNDDSTFNIALDETNYGGCQLSVRLKAIDGKDRPGGGVVWRARDARNYYLCRFNPLESNFRVYRVVDGKRTQLN